MSLQPGFHHFKGWFLKNPFLVVKLIVIGTCIPNFTFLASVAWIWVMSPHPLFHSFKVWFLKNSSLAFTYIVLGNYIPNFTFLVLMVLNLRYETSISISTLQVMFSEKFFLSGYIHHDRNLHSKFHVSSTGSFGSAMIVNQSVRFSFYTEWFI